METLKVREASRYSSVRALLRAGSRWIQGVMATKNRETEIACSAYNPDACCFCLAGAARHVYGNGKSGKEALRRLAEAIGHTEGNDEGNVTGWNDQTGRTVEEVRDIAKKAGV